MYTAVNKSSQEQVWLEERTHKLHVYMWCCQKNKITRVYKINGFQSHWSSFGRERKSTTSAAIKRSGKRGMIQQKKQNISEKSKSEWWSKRWVVTSVTLHWQQPVAREIQLLKLSHFPLFNKGRGTELDCCVFGPAFYCLISKNDCCNQAFSMTSGNNKPEFLDRLFLCSFPQLSKNANL